MLAFVSVFKRLSSLRKGALRAFYGFIEAEKLKILQGY
jgi:hypothetical protein